MDYVEKKMQLTLTNAIQYNFQNPTQGLIRVNLLNNNVATNGKCTPYFLTNYKMNRKSFCHSYDAINYLKSCENKYNSIKIVIKFWSSSSLHSKMS